MNGDLVAPEKDGYIYGITGGNAYVDNGLKGTVSGINSILGTFGQIAGIDKSLIDTVGTVNTILGKTDAAEANTVIDGAAGLHLQNYGHDWVRYYGAVGGDISVNTGLEGTINLKIGSSGNGTELLKEATETNIIRNGNVSNQIDSGSVIGGIGGSAAVTVGNIDATGSYTKSGIPWIDSVGIEADVTTDGKTSTTINGNVITTAEKDANVIGWMNGGAAAAIGGTAASTVTGDTTLTIDGTDRADHEGKYETPGTNDILPQLTTALNVMKGSKVNAIGVLGGGTAVTTLGGTAKAEVGGTSTINVNDATVLGMVGGGAAASVDATGAAEAVMGGQLGNNDGTSGFGISSGDDGLKIVTGAAEKDALVKVNINDANEGGTAESTTGDTYLNITGDSTVIGAVGGGIAAASQTYTVRPENAGGAIPEGYEVNDAYGKSVATATTGRSHITVNLPNSAMADEKSNAWNEVSGAVGGFISGIKGNSTQAESLAALDGKGGVFGIFGGGVAVGHGSASSTLSGMDNGALAIANTAGSDIKLQQGYAAAVFGGGAAVTINNARAEANMIDDVRITTEGSMKTVGLFGGGVAISMEGETAGTTGAESKGVTDGNVAKSTVGTVNIENSGDTKGIFGGGMAIGNSNRGIGDDALSSVTESNITVHGGTVSQLDMGAFMSALRNDHKDSNEWPQWSVLGFNASGAMVDLKGIMDETSIAAGGLGLGMTGKAEVTTANVTITGEDTIISKDILGGGIAVDNMNGADGGAHVGTSTINLNGGTVEGSIYAGGAVNGTTPNLVQGIKDENNVVHGYDASGTSSTVDTATVNLNGTAVAGEISGQGYKVTTNYAEKAAGSEGENKFNPYENDQYNATYPDKEIYESVADGQSTLNISGMNTLSALDTSTEGKYTGTSKIHDFDEVNVEAGSVTKLDGETVKADSTALIDGGLITTDRTAQIDLNDLEVNVNDSAYKIASNTAKGSTFWTHEDQLAYDRTEKYAVLDSSAEDNGHYNVTMKTVAENAADAGAAAEEAYGVAGLKDAFANQLNTGWKDHEGAKGYFSATSSAGQYTLGGRGMLFGEDAAVTGNTASIARLMADNVMQRLSFTDDYVKDAGWVNEDGGIWAKYVHNKYETSGMSSSVGGIRSSTDYDGAIVGVDIAKNGNFQYGAAIHYGSGDGDGILSHNDYDAWGLALYASLKDEEAGTNLMADIGWLTTDNDIDGTVNGKSMSADRDVDAWTIGVRGEKEFVSGQNQIVPYVGLRYMSINPGAYSVYWGGEKFSSYDADNQNLWLLPIGVSLRNETVTGAGWRITPKLDLSYIWAFGDTDTNVNLDLGNSLYYDVMDDDSWLASLGIEATKDVWSFGVGYGYQKGDDTKNKTWFVNASYAF